MQINSLIKYLPVILKYPSSIIRKKKYIFIISHMRSYSSLLSHVLGSHKDIDGYSELHYSYNQRLDTIKAKIQVLHTLENPLKGKFILDKLLHNSNYISNDFINKYKPKLVFMLRNPECAYKSWLNLGKRFANQNDKYLNEIHQYYLSRLEFIEEQSRLLDTDKLLIISEDIVNNTDGTFIKLQNFIGLEKPLSKTYQQFKFTGNRSYGDSSQNIKQSTINSHETRYDNIVIPKNILEEALISYHKFKDKLKRQCEY